MQKHITDVQEDMSTIGEQFLFDVVNSSEELTFCVFDRAKDYGSKFQNLSSLLICEFRLCDMGFFGVRG
jgi:hypothetical protein